MILTLAFAKASFKKRSVKRFFSFWGHIRIQSYYSARVAIAEETPIHRSDSVTNLKQLYPAIKTVQAFATKNAILEDGGNNRRRII